MSGFYSSKKGFLIWIILFFLLTACISSCAREDMYDFAKNGIPVIYAITSNGTEYKLIVATDEGYFKEYMTGITDSGAVTSFAAAADGTVVFGVGTNYYTHDEDSYSSWTGIPALGSGFINGICGDKHNIYAQVTDLGLEYIYGLDSGSKTWYQMGQITTAGVFAGFFYSKSDKAIYHYRIVASTNLYFYRISGGQAILESSPATLFSTVPPHSMKYRSYYYAADSTSYLRAYDSSGEIFVTAAPIASPNFAVVDSGTIFAANVADPNVYLSRLNMTTLSWGTPLITKNLGTSPLIKVKVCDSNTLALGMTSAGDGGLYTFNTGTNELKQITPMKIQNLDVK